MYLRKVASGYDKKRVAIVGVDDNTISLGRAITTESNLPFTLVGFSNQKYGFKAIRDSGKTCDTCERWSCKIAEGIGH